MIQVQHPWHISIGDKAHIVDSVELPDDIQHTKERKPDLRILNL